MAHYRKIDVQMWNDASFISLKPAAKLAFVFLITHPGMTSVGAMRASLPGLAAELGISVKDFSEVIAKGMAKFDENSSCVLLPNFLKYQSAESPNVIKNWVKQLAFVPESHLKDEAIALLVAYCEGMREGFQKAFHEAFAKEYPNTVSSKQLAVSKPPYPAMKADGGNSVGIPGDAAKTPAAIDSETGEVLSWAA